MDDFIIEINNVNNGNIDEFCELNLSKKIDNMGTFLFANNAEKVLSSILNLFGSNQLNKNNKQKLADFLIQAIDNDGRLENIIWNQIYISFNVQGIGVVQNDLLYTFVNHIILDRPINKKVCIFLMAFVMAIVLIA